MNQIVFLLQTSQRNALTFFSPLPVSSSVCCVSDAHESLSQVNRVLSGSCCDTVCDYANSAPN